MKRIHGNHQETDMELFLKGNLMCRHLWKELGSSAPCTLSLLKLCERYAGNLASCDIFDTSIQNKTTFRCFVCLVVTKYAHIARKAIYFITLKKSDGRRRIKKVFI